MKDIEIIQDVQEFFISDPKQSKLIIQLHTNSKNEAIKKKVMEEAAHQFKIRQVKEDEIPSILQDFEEYMWKYYVVEPLLNDVNITDINLYDYDHVTVRTVDNRRYVTNILFRNEEDYRRFIRVTALKNQQNLSNINAQQVFVDATSNENYKLRIDISTELINCHGKPYMHIRKNPKKKFQIEDLVASGTMTQKEADYIVYKFNTGKGTLIVGEGNSGKTTLFNALLDKYDHNKKGLIAQESDGELFTDPKTGHPDMLFQHLIRTNGEGGVEYELGDLIEKGLVSDFNLFGVGEVKDAITASKLLNASLTGTQVITTTHGPDEFAGIEKLGDYVHQGTGYSLEECLKLLRTFETVVFMDNRKVRGIAHIKGWNQDTKQLIIESVNPNEISFPIEDKPKASLKNFLIAG